MESRTVETESFGKDMALDVMEDALTNLDTAENCGMAAGLCSAFYMCGLLDQAEWQALLDRIPPPPNGAGAEGREEH